MKVEHLSVCLTVCLSACLPACLPACLVLYLSASLSLYVLSVVRQFPPTEIYSSVELHQL